jgi:alcohol dehydrogenase (cytochrome c)
MIYWPTGNPSPNFDGNARRGDNLYTNSVVALDADRGILRWHFQFTPHDVFDWDATEIPVLLEENIAGKRQRLLAQANRNGFFYLLDAETGKFLLAKPFAKQTWADEIDSHGRPVVSTTAHPTKKGTTIYPGVGGATNWESPSYSPLTGLMYVPVLDWGGIFFEEHAERRQGELFLGGSFQFFPNDSSQGAVRALNPMTGELQWEYRNAATNIGGLLSTGGGVVFGSQDQCFFALDANTGHELWRVSTGGRTVAAPITFLYQGRQMVTIAAGHDILTFGLQ